MNSKTFITALMSVAIVVFTNSALLAQEEQEEEGHVFTVSTYKVPYDKIEAYMELWEEEMPLVKKNEFVLSERVFRHLWGPEWAVLVVTEYETLSSIEAADKRGEELFEEKYPDQDKRDELDKQFVGFFTDHTDAIVIELPKLRK